MLKSKLNKWFLNHLLLVGVSYHELTIYENLWEPFFANIPN